LVLGEPECKETGRSVRLAGGGEGIVSILTLVPALVFLIAFKSHSWIFAATGGLLLVILLQPVFQLVIGLSTGWVLVGTPESEAAGALSRKLFRATILVMLLFGGVFWLLNT